MDILKVKQNGEWVGIPAIKGDRGETGPQGDPGDPTELIDDTAGSGETGKTWSADKLADLADDVGDKYEKPATGIPASDLAAGVIPAVPVQDVQVNGVSVLNQGVANVPVADTNNPGVVKVSNTYGLDIGSSGQHLNFIRIFPAPANRLKGGDGYYSPVTTNHQHESTFYGLAKAAGSDMASSSNPVGTYTDAAKVAIQKMLGIYEPPFELIRDITLTERTSIDITVDENGLPFELLSAFLEVSYPANLDSESSGYGRYAFYDSDNKYALAETGRYVTNSSPTFKYAYANRKANMIITDFTRLTQVGTYNPWYIKSFNNYGICFDVGNIVRIKLNDADYEPAGTRIRIYGQKAY